VTPIDASRRRFLAVSLAAGGALLLRVRVRDAHAAPTPGVPPELLGDDLTELGPFLRIERDNRIVIGARTCETGTGVRTAQAMLIAEDLDVDWEQVTVVALPYGYRDDGGNRYGSQTIGRGAGLDATWTELRRAGATARWLLVQAAAREWSLDPASLRTESGQVFAPDGRRLTYGALARAASTVDPPAQPPPLKMDSGLRIIGTPTRTADGVALVTGASRFGIDEYAANALTAVIARCPHPGGTLVRFDDGEARKVSGLVDVTRIEGPDIAPGVAVVADHTWAALQARERLAIEWKPGPWADASSAALASAAQAALDGEAPGETVRRDGDPAALRRKAARTIEARYELPFLAHATMEPPAALVDIRNDRARLVAPVEDPDAASQRIAALTGLPRARIEIRMPRGGGSFGRRMQVDYIAEAVRVAQAVGKPIRLMWTRGDDLAHDTFRPFGVHALRATLDRRGRITGWSHRCAATPHQRDGADMTPSWTGCLDADSFPAGLLADVEQVFHPLEAPLPRTDPRWATQAFATFAIESFIDEIAVATRQDALALRLALLGEPRRLDLGGRGYDTGRLAEVLRRCAARIGWGVRRSDGHGIGIACHQGGGGYIAHGFEASVEGERLVLHRAVVVADVGRMVNPLGTQMLLEDGTLDGIATTLHQAITVRDGRVLQHDLRDYGLMRRAQAPREVEVEIVDSGAAPARASTIAPVSAAPALANAVYAATTVRVRKLPLMPELMRML